MDDHVANIPLVNIAVIQNLRYEAGETGASCKYAGTLGTEASITTRMSVGNFASIKIASTLALSLAACTCQTVERSYGWNAVAANGMALVVEKDDSVTTRTGMLTGRDYGSVHRFTYRLRLDTD